MKALAKIAPRSPADLRAGTLRQRDLKAFDALLEAVGGTGTVIVTGTEGPALEGAVGLAAAAAAAGTRTALLECELAAPALARALGLVSEPGLREYLREEAQAPQILQPLVLAGPGSARATEPLACIVAGRPTPDGQELLASDAFRHVAARLAAGYQLVVIDGPHLGRGMAGLEAVAAHADASIVCLDRSDARGRQPRRLRRALRQMPPRFAGLVSFE